MQVLTTVHFVLAFLTALCALIFSWNALGRRVMNAVVGLQVLAGLALAGSFGAAHLGLPHILWLHIVLAFVALIAYAFARRVGEREGGARVALGLSVLGLVCVFVTIYLGLHMAGSV